jgi:uncharacterized membrane protein
VIIGCAEIINLIKSMDTEKKLDEMLVKVDMLSAQITAHQKEIDELKSQINHLQHAANPHPSFQYQKGKIAISNNKKTIPFKTIYYKSFENFVGLKLIHFVGILVLIAGLSIGVKYGIDKNMISPLLRIVLAYAAGIILYLLSLQLRKKYLFFSMVLFSGAMASLYFTTYAAFEYYDLLLRTTAFIIMVLLTCFTVYHSLKYNRQEIALLGLTGAYAVPFFVGGNSGSIWTLFGYICLINAGILYISFKKYWTSLIHVSFVTTWVIFFSWLFMRTGNSPFTAELFFAALFYGMFSTSALAFKFLKKEPVEITDSIVIIVSTLFLYTALLIIFQKHSLGPSIATLTLLFGIVYLAAGLITKKYLQLQAYFADSLLAVSLVAFVFFVAKQYNGLTITLIWLVMAAAFFVVGMWQQIKFLRIASMALLSLTLIKLVLVDSSDFDAVEKIIAYILTGSLLLIISFLYQKFKHKIFGNDGD